MMGRHVGYSDGRSSASSTDAVDSGRAFSWVSARRAMTRTIGSARATSGGSGRDRPGRDPPEVRCGRGGRPDFASVRADSSSTRRPPRGPRDARIVSNRRGQVCRTNADMRRYSGPRTRPWLSLRCEALDGYAPRSFERPIGCGRSESHFPHGTRTTESPPWRGPTTAPRSCASGSPVATPALEKSTGSINSFTLWRISPGASRAAPAAGGALHRNLPPRLAGRHCAGRGRMVYRWANPRRPFLIESRFRGGAITDGARMASAVRAASSAKRCARTPDSTPVHQSAWSRTIAALDRSARPVSAVPGRIFRPAASPLVPGRLVHIRTPRDPSDADASVPPPVDRWSAGRRRRTLNDVVRSTV